MTTLPLPEPLVRQAAAAVAAQSDMPFDPVRYGKALDLVLAGAVELRADGTAHVCSGETTYTVADTCTCGCPDAAYRGAGCKHVLAAAIARETCLLLAEAGLAAGLATRPQAGRPAAWSRQQAPATCHVEVPLGQLRLSYTFRGTTDAEVLTRLRTQLPQLQALRAAGEASVPVPTSAPVAPPTLTTSPPALTPDAVQALVQHAVQQALAAQSAAPQPSQATATGQATPEPDDQTTGFCSIHQVAMAQKSNARGAWFSHWLKAEQQHCKGRRPSRR